MSPSVPTRRPSVPRAEESWARRALPTFFRAADWLAGKLRGLGSTAIGAMAFSGAQSTRLTADWILAPIASADQELRGSLRTLRARARELARNDPHASRFLALLEENIVGPDGIRLQSRVKTGNRDTDRRLNRRIEDAWREWGRPESCYVDGRMSWIDGQNLSVRTRSQDGEHLVRMIEGYEGNRFGFALQALDADQLDADLNRPRKDGQNEIRMGVEVDRYGRPVAYHVFRSHPYDYMVGRGQRDTVRVPASQIIHRYLVRRPGQTRGVTDFAPVLMPTRMLNGLREAELVGSRVEASKGGFFKREPEAQVDPNSARGSKRRLKMSVEPGLFEELPPGLDFQPWNPTRPNTAFAPFEKSVLKTIAAGLRGSYAGITGDLTEVSFSSIRKGDLQERDVWRCLQALEAAHFHERVFQRWLIWALTTGALTLPTRRAADWSSHAWMPRGWEWVDPLKDLLGAELAIQLAVDSRTNIAAQRGRDFEEVLEDLKREQEMAEAAGIDLGTAEAGARAFARRLAVANDEEGDMEHLVALLEQRAGLTGNGSNGVKHAHR